MFIIFKKKQYNYLHCFPLKSEEEQARAGSLPRLPSITGTSTVAASAGPVKSARYRAPGFRTATRAASAPGLHVPRRRRPPPTPQQPPPAAPASAPSLQGECKINYLPTSFYNTVSRYKTNRFLFLMI